ncbi:MAG TPA: LemA family protein [Bacteroidia bacterium]|jgi:LemA protein|nr:LemA family protein [Bacteroidia bacterium]
MKTSSIVLGVLLLIIAIFCINGCNTRNSLVEQEVAVTGQWHQVENQYQRRMDLIPNLVATVKNYADFEKSTLEGVIQARAKATQVTIDPSKLDEASIQKFQQAQSAVSSSLGRLLAVAENYPQLKANEGYINLATQIEGTENRIGNERKVYNEMVQKYNANIRLFPANIWAGMFGFQPKPFFEGQAGSDKAPDVNNLFKK